MVVYHFSPRQIDKASAEVKLKAAKPALAEAERALNTIKPTHIATVRKLGKPPHLIMRIMDTVLLLFQRRIGPAHLDPERDSPTPSWGDSLKVSYWVHFYFNYYLLVAPTCPTPSWGESLKVS